MRERWRIELLGGLRATRAQTTVTRFRTQKTGALLAYLAFYRDRRHAREALIDLLWPEAARETGQHNLRLALSSLRRQLEPPGVPSGSVVTADRSAVQLRPDAVFTDVAEFAAFLHAAEAAADPVVRRQFLTESVELYAGELLPGCYEPWIVPQQICLEDEFVRAVLGLAACLEESGDRAGAIRAALRAIGIHPEQEPLHALLIRLYAASGQTAAALRQYERLEKMLREEFGEEPSSEVRGFVEAARRDTAPAPAARAPRNSPAGKPLDSGTTTFLLLDHAPPEGNETLRALFAQHEGRVIQWTDAGWTVAFGRARDALACAVACFRAFSAPPRMALHSGEAIDEKESGPEPSREDPLARAARLLAAGHPGQILCSEATSALLRFRLPNGLGLMPLGVYRLGGLPERIFQVTLPDQTPSVFPPVNAPAAHEGSLPLTLTRFVGRAAEITEIARLLGPQELMRPDPAVRLVTLTGTGGAGKTRLAIEVARRMMEAYKGAVWFVPLADIANESGVVEAIGKTLALPGPPGADIRSQIVDALAQQPALLILDNCEHVVAAAAGVVGWLLQSAPTVTCLATTRQRLGLAGEREFRLSPLSVPEVSAGASPTPELLCRSESVQLFIDRAQAVRPDFQVTPGNARAVAELCARLEGIPLTIELVAARSLTLSPAQMLGRLAGRLDFFASRERGGATRHRTLRAAIDWSYDLLAPPLQQFLVRLSVFRAGWTMEAAEAVCELPDAEGTTLDFLTELYERSLIARDPAVSETRFVMLETLREYAGERLSPEESEALRHDHALYFRQLSLHAQEAGWESRNDVWLERLAPEYENLRAALRFLLDNSAAPEPLEMASALWRFWMSGNLLREGDQWLAESLERVGNDAPPLLRARGLRAAGILAHDLADFARARTLLTESVALYQDLEDDAERAPALQYLASAALYTGDQEAAEQLTAQCLHLAQQRDDRFGVGHALWNQARLIQGRGEADAAHDRFQQALAVFREVGNQWGVSSTLNYLARLALSREDLAAAETFAEECLAGNREAKQVSGIAYSLETLARIALRRREYARAHLLLRECVPLFREFEDTLSLLNTLALVGDLALARECHKPAARLVGAMTVLTESLGPLFDAGGWDSIRALCDALRAKLGESAFVAATVEGRVLGWDEASAEALSAASP